MFSKQDAFFFSQTVLIDLSLLQEARDQSKAVSDLTNKDILYEDKGVWIGSLQSNNREQLSHK